jgi:hypothetical protein
VFDDTSSPEPVAASSVVGTDAVSSRGDHVHAGTTATGTVVDEAITRFNGTGGASLQGYSSLSPTISDAGIISLTSGALKFPATAIASADANTLSDYEEGSFSPLLYDQAGNAAPSMGATVGRYTRIGNRVFFHFQILADSISGMTTDSQVVVRGLPFTSVNVANTEAIIGFGHADGFAITAGVYVNGIIGVNSSYIYMVQWTATTGTTDFLVSNLSANGQLKADGVYEVAT